MNVLALTTLLLMPLAALHAAEPSAVAPPQSPKAYAIPSQAVRVTSSTDLITELGKATAQDIVLADGIYTNSKVVLFAAPHRLWSEHLGKAMIKFGFSLGRGSSGGTGAEIHGVSFDVSSPYLTEHASIITIWGQEHSSNAQIYDCSFRGNHALQNAILAHSTSALIVKRAMIRGLNANGIVVIAAHPDYLTDSPSVPPVIEDIDVSGIYQTPRGKSNGTAESGLWLGVKCTVNRVRVSDTGWMGIWTGANCNDAVLSDITIDNIWTQNPVTGDVGGGVGIYVEHFTRRCVIQRFHIGPARAFPWEPGHYLSTGINLEWADPGYTNPVQGESLAGSHFNTFKDGVVNTSFEGLSSEDSERTTVSNVTFRNQSAVAIKEFRTSGKDHDMVWQNQGNGFSGILPGAVDYARSHRSRGLVLQPRDQTVTTGSQAIFKAHGTGGYTPVNYQWQKNGVNIPGATQNTFSFTATESDNGSAYRVILSNKSGSTTSKEALLTVKQP
jgi:hypothetical protein